MTAISQTAAPAGHNFEGQTVIVTGAARGIGLTVSRRFIEAGASVVMVDVDAEELWPAARSVGGIPRPADVSNSASVEDVVMQTIADTGRIDVIFNNAGLVRDKMLWKIDDEDWTAVIEVSLGGTFRLTRACVPHFRERSYGRVVNVTSYTGLHGNIGQAAYGAAKAGVIGFTKTAAKELARFGVTVNAVSPNASTRMTDAIAFPLREAIEQAIPLGRFADPNEVAGAVLYLASPDAGYVTGAVLPVDGGLSI